MNFRVFFQPHPNICRSQIRILLVSELQDCTWYSILLSPHISGSGAERNLKSEKHIALIEVFSWELDLFFMATTRLRSYPKCPKISSIDLKLTSRSTRLKPTTTEPETSSDFRQENTHNQDYQIWFWWDFRDGAKNCLTKKVSNGGF